MSDTVGPASGGPQEGPGLLARLAAARWVLSMAAAIVFLLVLLDRLSWLEALIVMAGLAAASLLYAPWPDLGGSFNSKAGSRAPGDVDAHLAAAVEALDEPALLTNRHESILAANDAAMQAFGPLRRGDPLSFTVRAPEVIEAVRGAAGDGKPRRVEFIDRVPVERSFEAHVAPMVLSPAQNGHAPATPDVILVTFRDLTRQRRVERIRADFVANASHELRTPLASLSGFIETLQGAAREDPAARERFLGIMAAQARRMSRLIEDLLSLSRVELNEHIHPQTPIDLAAIVAHVCDTLAPLARERGVEIELRKDTAPLTIQGERDELIRLFENLVENAIKYGAEGKRIEVAVRCETADGAAEEAVVSVRDFGPGIAPDHVPRLTERFYRVDVEASRAEGGTGLGLAIVKHILARHRGRLVIESELGQGATFTARIPLTPGEEEKTQKDSME